jgi:hypothetical protein
MLTIHGPFYTIRYNITASDAIEESFSFVKIENTDATHNQHLSHVIKY